MTRDYSYFHEGIEHVPTTSSALVSSSRFLNHAGLRDWLQLHLLRRNGPDLPIPSDPTMGLAQALGDLRTPARMQTLIDFEKERNPAFKTWIEEKYLSPLTEDDFAKYPAGSFGNDYYRHLTAFGIKVNFGWANTPPASDWEFIQKRNGQIHDYEHLMTGGQFNSLGEILPYMVRLSNPHTHLTAEVATELSLIYIFGGSRMLFRSFLQYPETWPTVLDLMRRGLAIGQASEPIMMMRYEDALDLPVEEARALLGYRMAEDVDTEAMDKIFTEQVKGFSVFDQV